MEMAEAVGLAVRRVRKQRGSSQEELAWQADLDRTYISGVERGLRNPSLASLVKIAEALEVRLSRLVTIAEQIQSGRIKVTTSSRLNGRPASARS
jgi:transcriptional regulator with XRE-family HTH domain